MIYNKYFENIFTDKISKNSKMFKIFNFKNLVFGILAMFLTALGFIQGSYPFGYATLAVASLFNVPLIVVLIATLIGIAVFKMPVVYLLTFTIFFIVFTFITAVIKIEGVSKKSAVMLKLISSIIITEVIALIFNAVPNKDIFTSIYTVLGSSVFYLIFTSGIYVILNYRKNFVFSKEEYLAAMTVITLLIASLHVLRIPNFSVVNVLCMILILVYGWKNGAINGSAMGLIVGLLISVITNTNITQVIIYTFTGFSAGILSRYGKIPTILGFLAGAVLINFWVNGPLDSISRIGEIILVASFVFIFPKKFEIRLDKFFNKNIALDNPYENVLDYASSVKNKLNAVSDVFENLSKISIDLSEENYKENRVVIKKYIVEFVDNNCISCKDKKKCLNEEQIVEYVEKIATKLENNEDSNNIDFNINCDNSNKIVKDIKEIYNSMKLMRLLKQKQEKSNEKISDQYKEVSKIIKMVSENINNMPIKRAKLHDRLRDEFKLNGYVVYEDEYIDSENGKEYTFITDILSDIDKQKNQVSQIASNILEKNMVIKLILNSSKNERSKIRLTEKAKYDIDSYAVTMGKSREEVVGDSYLLMELEDLNHIIALSDGAGSGQNAQKSSQITINMLEKLLNGGFDNSKAIEIINNVIKLKNNDTHFSTLDAFVFNPSTADSQFIKLGAAPSYILEDNRVTTINTLNIPLGLIEDSDHIPIVKKLKNGSLVVQVSDGVIGENYDVTNNYFTRYLQTLDVAKNSKVISEELIRIVLKENENLLKDDVTIIVSKVKENII